MKTKSIFTCLFLALSLVAFSFAASAQGRPESRGLDRAMERANPNA